MNKYKIGDIISGKVTGIEDYGIFVSINDNCSGLIHISEISDAFVRNINDYVNLDEVINVEVIGFDGNSHIKLSIKNINYRINSPLNKRIIETKSGFSTLKFHLNDWVLKKEEENLKKNKKNE